MEINTLNAISPIDGRYRSKTEALAPYFSEAALIRFRVLVEVEYFITLVGVELEALKGFPTSKYEEMRKIYKEFSLDDAQRVKDIEKTTNHDVKAVEYFLKEQFDNLGLSAFKEFIHFGLTSQDINNTAIPLTLKKGMEEVYIPQLERLMETIKELSERWKDVPMLARTHGQPASPTRLGKELYVFVERLEIQLDQLKTVPIPAKFGGATGNFNAHHVAYPEVDWVDFSNKFINDVLGLKRSQTTTQIEHYDNLGAIFDAIKRINTILIDFNRDIWSYISINYFKQKLKKGEVGSSTMPHKVNPIDFENSEGNLGIANAFFEHLSAKLPISRMQRDLTDSTVLRNVGVPLSHSSIALASTQKGLGKLLLNEESLQNDLEENWAVVAEAIQTILRREGFANPYEELKKLTRKNTKITEKGVHDFIDSLDVDDAIKTELRAITPQNYLGI